MAMKIAKPSPGGKLSLVFLAVIALLAISLWFVTDGSNAPLRDGTTRSNLCLGIGIALQVCSLPLSMVAYPYQAMQVRDTFDVVAWSIILPFNALLWGYGSTWCSNRIGVWTGARPTERQRRITQGLCPRCEYDVRGSAKGQICPECGEPISASA
ncbi:MAG: hypothetical protein NTW19_24135 [Planctomycetota bacterium]|nr:hypothetical protein [Planctomycetota bacterium]